MDELSLYKVQTQALIDTFLGAFRQACVELGTLMAEGDRLRAQNTELQLVLDDAYRKLAQEPVKDDLETLRESLIDKPIRGGMVDS